MILLDDALISLVNNCIGSSPSGDGYILYFPDSSRLATSLEILSAKKIILQDQAYKIAAQKLNAQSADYGDAEKATWGILQQEAQVFNTSGAVGPTLQRAVDNTIGLHTVATLAAKLTALAQYQDAVLQARAQHIKNISTLTDGLETYDIMAGWP